MTNTVEIEPCVLTVAQEQQWGDTMSLMQWTAPGFRHLFYKLLTNNKGKYGAVMTRSVPVAATDAKNILINPDTFFKYSLKERVFIIGHEIIHNVYGDVEFLARCNATQTVPIEGSKTLPFINALMQKAMDFRINPLLVDSRIGALPTSAKDYPPCFDLAIAVANDSITDVYKKLFEDEDAKGNITRVKCFDQLLPPGAGSPGQAPSPRNDQQWAVEIASAQTLENMKSQGHMNGSLMRMFEKLLNPEIPWTDHIRGIMMRTMGNGSYDWRRADRRFIVRDICYPSRSGKGSGWLVVWGDTSGSIGNAELCRYMAELSGIIEDCRPKRLTILWCDSKIHRVDEVEEACDLQRIQAEGVGGGGGTSVHPVMKWIEDGYETPEMMVAFTDGWVTFPPKAPTFPVIWASTTDRAYPWGEVVRLKT